jgi:hypothetical protein
MVTAVPPVVRPVVGEIAVTVGAGVATERLTVDEWFKLPLVPAMVMVELPRGVDVEVATVSVDDPEPAIDVGLNVAVAFCGSPEAARLTVPLNPPEAVTVTL